MSLTSVVALIALLDLGVMAAVAAVMLVPSRLDRRPALAVAPVDSSRPAAEPVPLAA